MRAIVVVVVVVAAAAAELKGLKEARERSE